ncbi:wolframin-like [Ornithodoros turicata]|uniref:wolframin-like n=1 Tax=Ornithodoros turicata TaxID=34597 RepID=UPI003139C676
MFQTEGQPRHTPRKQWMLHNGSSCNVVLKLRYRFAEEGCSASQVSIARSLLSESAEDPSAAEVAVSYLTRAAEQDDAEGLSLLEQCYKNRVGVTDRNISDVERCLGKSNTEKTASRVAKQILDFVTPDGSVTLSESVFRRRLQDGHGKLTPDTDCHPRVGVSDITNAVTSCIEGQPPALLISQRERISNRLLLYLEDLTAQCTAQLASFNLWTNLFLTSLLLLVICASLYSPIILKFVQHEPSVIFLASLALAVAFTAHLWRHKVDCENLRAWIALVTRFDAAAVTSGTRQRFQRFFYVKLFFHASATVACLCASLEQLKYVEFALLSRSDVAVFTALIFGSIFYDTVTRSKAKLAVATSIFALTARDFNFPLVALVSFVPDMFYMPYLYWPAVGLKYFAYSFIIFKDDCTICVQNFVCVAWFHACIHVMQSCDLEDVLTAILSIVFWLVLCSYIKPMHSTFTVLALRQLMVADWLKVALSSFALYCLYKCVALATKKLRSCNNLKTKTALCPVYALLILSVAAFSYDCSTEERHLDVDKYKSLCQESVLGDANTAVMQQACAAYVGAKAQFSGHVASVEIVDVHNVPKRAISLLPRSVHDTVARLIGNKWPSCHPRFQTETDYARCQLYKDLRLPAYHLEAWNVYSFELSVELESGFQAVVVTDSTCRDFVARLKSGSAIDVKGQLTSVVGVPKIWLLRAAAEDSVCDRSFELSWDIGSYVATFLEFVQFVF